MTDVQMTTHLLDNMRALGVDAYRDRFDNVVIVDIDATHRATMAVSEDGSADLIIFTMDDNDEPCADEVIDHPVTYRDAETIARLIRSYR